MDDMELPGRHFVLRMARGDDAEILAMILLEPSVARWWPTHDLDRVMELLREDLVPGI